MILVRSFSLSSFFPSNDHDKRADKDLTRTACQALANLITGNDKLASSYLPARLQLEEKDHLIQYVSQPARDTRLTELTDRFVVAVDC